MRPVRPGRPIFVAVGTVALVVTIGAVVAAYDGSPGARVVVAILGAAWFGVWLLATAPRDNDPP